MERIVFAGELPLLVKLTIYGTKLKKVLKFCTYKFTLILNQIEDFFLKNFLIIINKIKIKKNVSLNEDKNKIKNFYVN